jgi:hypothetical protein
LLFHQFVRVAAEQGQLDPPGVPVQVRVVGPDCVAVSPSDLRRLFRGRRLTPARRARLAQSGRALAWTGGRVVGLAAYDRAGAEFRVHEFGLDDDLSPFVADQVLAALLDALEVTCLAGGGRRLVLLPRAAIATSQLRLRGFVTIAEGCAGSWFEKSFPS